MKTFLISTLIILISATGFAQAKLDAYQPTLTQVLELEKAGDLRSAAIVSANASYSLTREIGAGQVVAEVSSRLEKIRQEIVTQESKMNGGLRVLFLKLSGNAHWDTAEIVTINPDEVAGFPAKVRSDFSGLQSKLAGYVSKNELSIVYAKAFAAKALQLANKLTAAERASVSELVELTVQNSQLLTFYGEQTVSQCTTTNYANRSRGGGIDMKAIFFAFKFSGEETQLAHSRSECSSYARSTSVGEASALSARIGGVDYLIAQQWKQWGVLQLEIQAPYYPTWGLPYN